MFCETLFRQLPVKQNFMDKTTFKIIRLLDYALVYIDYVYMIKVHALD